LLLLGWRELLALMVVLALPHGFDAALAATSTAHLTSTLLGLVDEANRPWVAPFCPGCRAVALEQHAVAAVDRGLDSEDTARLIVTTDRYRACQLVGAQSGEVSASGACVTG